MLDKEGAAEACRGGHQARALVLLGGAKTKRCQAKVAAEFSDLALREDGRYIVGAAGSKAPALPQRRQALHDER